MKVSELKYQRLSIEEFTAEIKDILPGTRRLQGRPSWQTPGRGSSPRYSRCQPRGSLLLCPQGAVTGVDVRGGSPGTRDTDSLDPPCNQ